MNPSDPEATFRKKAGAKHMGYVGNIIESVGESGSIVTDYAYEQNVYSDSQFMKDYLFGQPVNDEMITLTADRAYGGEINISQAMEHQIKLVATNFTRPKPDDIYAEFRFNEDAHFRNGVEAIPSLLRRRQHKIDWKKSVNILLLYHFFALKHKSC